MSFINKYTTITHKISKIDTVNLESSPTDIMKFSVCFPIHIIKPNLSTASINTNIAAKNKSVGHSTRDKIESISFLSVIINKRITPISADHLEKIFYMIRQILPLYHIIASITLLIIGEFVELIQQKIEQLRIKGQVLTLAAVLYF